MIVIKEQNIISGLSQTQYMSYDINNCLINLYLVGVSMFYIFIVKRVMVRTHQILPIFPDVSVT